MTRLNLAIAAVVALSLSACDAPSPEISTTVTTTTTASAGRPALPPRSAQPPVRPLVAAGPAQSVPALASPEARDAAWVVRVDPLKKQNQSTIKLFGTGGGDPAMNGLYTHVAFYEGADAGWAVFRIGDFIDYRIVFEAAGRVDLEVTESVLQGDSGSIGSRKRRVIVGWAMPDDGSSPTSITLTPAR